MGMGANHALEVLHGHAFQLAIGRDVASFPQDLPCEKEEKEGQRLTAVVIPWNGEIYA